MHGPLQSLMQLRKGLEPCSSPEKRNIGLSLQILLWHGNLQQQVQAEAFRHQLLFPAQDLNLPQPITFYIVRKDMKILAVEDAVCRAIPHACYIPHLTCSVPAIVLR